MMMDASSDATFVIGPRGGIEHVNEDACSLLGYSRSELLELHGSELILPEERPKVAVSLDRMRRGVLEHRQGRLLRKNRSVIDVAVSARTLADGALVLTVRPLAAERH
jgi:PAS domain S-box-containing protein